MPTIAFLLALIFASFAPATTNQHNKKDHSGKVTTQGKPNNGDYIVGEDHMP